MNLCFKNLGIMNLCTSALNWQKLNKIRYMNKWMNCVGSRECRIWHFRESNFQKAFFGGAYPRTPPPPPPLLPLYNSCIRGWPSFSFSSNLVLNVQLQKNSIPRQNEWWYRVWMKQKFEHQRIQNETKLPLRKRQWHIQGRARGPPLFFDQNEAGRAEKKISGDCTPPPLSQGLDDRTPPYLKVWICHW